MKVAVYPGSFDPLTKGHIDIIERSLKLFDKVYVVVAENYEKKYLFSEEERVKLATEALLNYPGAIVVKGHGLLVNQAEELGSKVIIRGLRVVTDYEYEVQVAEVYRFLDPRIEMVYLLARKEFSFVSSTRIKEIYSLGGDISSLVPANVEKAMEKKYPKRELLNR